VSTDILTPAQRRAVEALGHTCGGMYDIGGIEAGTSCARRDDGNGQALEASTPGELDAALRADQMLGSTP
jgi:hypothetical protein